MALTPIQVFFEKSPSAKVLFDALVIAVINRFPNTTFEIQKSQIALVSNAPYAVLWLPLTEIKGHSKELLILSFGVDHEIKDPRFVEVNHPYPDRWMVHILIEKIEDIDETILSYLSLALDFSESKKGSSKITHA